MYAAFFRTTHFKRCPSGRKNSLILKEKYRQIFRNQLINIAPIKRSISYASASQSKKDDKIYLNEDSPRGEDGHVIIERGNHLHAAVFDGVGGSENSRQIVEFLKHYVRENKTIYGKLDTLAINQGVKQPTGSTTVACANISTTRLDCMIVGDSVVQVYRNDKLVFATKPLQHAWNMPTQMNFSQGVLKCTSPPAYETFPLQIGDIVILSTDGVTDNLFVEEIEKIISRKHEPMIISQLLIAKTKKKNNMKVVSTPFGKSIVELFNDPVALQEHKNKLFEKFGDIEQELKKMMIQSKEDDCTVITVRID